MKYHTRGLSFHNLYGSLFRFFCIEDNNATTHCVFAALLDHQDESSFEWLLKQYDQAIRRRPGAFFTDQDAAMLAAARNTWPDVPHLYVSYSSVTVTFVRSC